MIPAALSLHVAPMVPAGWLIALALATAVLLVSSAVRFRQGLATRAGVAAVLFLVLLNPSAVEERREPVPDVAVVIADRSPSQSFEKRTARTDAALAAIRAQLQGNKAIDLRVVDAPIGPNGPNASTRETHLFDAVDQAFADTPPARRAGVILITDGQVHDAPRDPARFTDDGPVSVLLTGTRRERDRRLVVTEAPSYGIVGHDVTIKYRVDDTAGTGETIPVTIRANGILSTLSIPAGQSQSASFAVDHAGQNVFEIEASPLQNEITLANNRAPVIVNGVRDRLRVLLVSGQPHNGGRIWRDMLTGDPGVDLVHFTILREPDKLDPTPQDELALIPFPFHELFEVKLAKFDLVIFDRYRLNHILPPNYFDNIAAYVRNGGALLEVSGPSFATAESIYATAVKDVLPAAPTGEVIEQPFRPALTDLGQRHPVTSGLPGAAGPNTPWGDWLRQVGVKPARGDVLMSGAAGRPLLILSHEGKGRVAQLASDEIWLWARGYEGGGRSPGGPYAELMRRLAHWLMKEPELDENALAARIDQGRLTVTRRSLDGKPILARVTAPDGQTTALSLADGGTGVLTASVTAPQAGVYTVTDGAQTRFAVNGDLNPPELSGVVTTADILAPVVRATGGATLWLADTPKPAVRLQSGVQSYGGRGWLGLRTSHGYTVTGVTERPVLPAWAWMGFLLTALAGGWWLEGRGRRSGNLDPLRWRHDLDDRR